MRFNPEEYESVDERLRKFWGAHPDGRVSTVLISDPNAIDECVVYAEIFFHSDEARPRGTGLASEKRNSGGANNGAHLENCETSAIGRALANCGFSGNKRASREEMQKVSRQQPERQAEPQQQATPQQGQAPADDADCVKCSAALMPARVQWCDTQNHGIRICSKCQQQHVAAHANGGARR